MFYPGDFVTKRPYAEGSKEAPALLGIRHTQSLKLRVDKGEHKV